MSNTVSGYLSEDLMLDIFERLPIKTIIRCTSLSKFWHSRLTTPDFIRQHLRRSVNLKTPEKILIRQQLYYGAFKEIYTLHSVDQLPFDSGCGYSGIPGVKFPYSDAQIVGSCNGILCLFDRDQITLWNFSIRRKVILPSYPLKDSGVMCGFGFDSVTDDYKVVGVSGCRSSFVYSLKTGSWSASAPPSTSFRDVKLKACFVNGKLHWVVSSTEGSCFILTFSLSSHVFEKIMLPESWGSIRELTIIDGCLAVISWKDFCTWIWVKREYDDNVASWSLLSKVTKVLELMRVLQPITNGDLLAYNRAREVYNPQTGLFAKLTGFEPYCFSFEMETYVESLELLDKGRPCGKTVWAKNNNQKRIRLSELLQYPDDWWY